MSVRYLYRGDNVQLSQQIGTAQLTPNQGQYWLPRQIRVGAQPLNTQPWVTSQHKIAATLYHGQSGDTSVDAYIDGTARGQGDVTGLMNGVIIQPGEYLTAQFIPLDVNYQSTPLQLVYLEIVGLSVDNIYEANQLLIASSPGPSFTMPLPNPMQMPPAAHVETAAQFLNPGQNNTVTLIPTSTRSYLYIYGVEAWTVSTSANNDGWFEPIGGAGTNHFAYYNPGTWNGPYQQDFHGERMNPGGLEWKQLGSSGINAVLFTTVVGNRAIPLP